MDFSGWFWLFMLWVLFFWLYRDYRLDYFRQRLFALRDQLFDLASEGKVGFDSDAYRLTRSMLNGTIRFGHKLGFIDILCVAIAARNADVMSRPNSFSGRLEAAYSDLDEDTRRELESIRRQMHVLMAEQTIFTSSVLVFSLVAVAFGLFSVLAGKFATKALGRLLSRAPVSRLMVINDYAAWVYSGDAQSGHMPRSGGPHALVGG